MLPSMALAVRIHRTGGPEVLRLDRIDLGTPGPGEVLLRHDAIGTNYIDIYHRSGLYPVSPLPGVLGLEAAGTIEEVGPGVHDFAVGDRVAYASVPMGASSQPKPRWFAQIPSLVEPDAPGAQATSMRRRSSNAVSPPASLSTSLRENSRAVPGPRLVRILESSTTRSST
jgi:NADPH:quinone reductase-like Zn-dependent oxidoreductase